MNILIAAAEAHPFAKAGGLADVVSSLARQWKKLGHNPIIILPKYRFINVVEYNFNPTFLTLNVPIGYQTEFAHLWKGYLPNSEVEVYLIEHDEYFNRQGIYGEEEEYFDNDKRFIFLSRAIFEAAKALEFYPNIIHSHDYHTAFAMAFLKTHYKNEPYFQNCAGVFTIHNLAYQGKFNPFRAMDFTSFGMKEFYSGSWYEQDGLVNCMKTGIMFADKITTVSPNYAFEIRMPYFSEGLHEALNAKGGDLIGILNGADYDEWNPSTDKQIYQNFDIDSIEIKNANKKAFLEQYGISSEINQKKPLIGIVTRLTEQKGIDIIMAKLEQYLGVGRFTLAVLGSGESKYVSFFNHLKTKYADSTMVYIGYNNELSHKIMAASDFLLMPSRFEPCGLTQMYALKYATIPIVRSTGGLKDTIFEYQKDSQSGNGFVFWHYNIEDFDFALNRALELYNDKNNLEILRENAMNSDFSALKSAEQYISAFGWAREKLGK